MAGCLVASPASAVRAVCYISCSSCSLPRSFAKRRSILLTSSPRWRHRARSSHINSGLQTGRQEDSLQGDEKQEAWRKGIEKPDKWIKVAAKASLLVAAILFWQPLPARAAEGGGASFTVKLFGRQLSFGDRTPGWAYFGLLMAAGCGLFVSEEALNVWVGGCLGRCLTYGQGQEAFYSSLQANAPFIVSTILWVYWGVCISDMVPFYAGRLAAKSGEKYTDKLSGVNKDKLVKVQATVQKYGNLIGVVERFALGVRNPTGFLAGAAGVSPVKFFAGVCLGGIFTLAIQLAVGFALRERPIAALASVAAVVGTWTVVPYLSATLVSLYFAVVRREPPGSRQIDSVGEAGNDLKQ